ncbi:hypothetical protein BJX66DRAFT_294124 [Aspergillus keveii]|uniref:Secreted protein n=1 Tax=Aspergillus keveii TaxID=714993 RepID=A0ABR4GKW6_9EURO
MVPKLRKSNHAWLAHSLQCLHVKAATASQRGKESHHHDRNPFGLLGLLLGEAYSERGIPITTKHGELNKRS